MTLQDTLRHFRNKYALTRPQANDFMSWPKATWTHVEAGRAEPPDDIEEKLARLATKLDLVMTAPVKRCPHCKKDVARWAANGGTHCPYCARIFRRSKKTKIFVHLKRKQPSGTDLDRKALVELGYTVDYKQKRKRREK